MQIEISAATHEDVPEIARVMSEAAILKASQDDSLWGTEPFSTEEVEGNLQAGGLYTVRCDGIIAGTVKLTETDTRVWEEDGANGDEALYVHQLATGDAVRGENVGEQVLNWAVDKARSEGRKAVRLDCGYTNRKLCEYYEKRGFVEIRRRDIPRKSSARKLHDPTYKVALFQRDIR